MTLQLEQTADNQIHFHVKYAWNHSKVTLLRSSDNHFVIEGS